MALTPEQKKICRQQMENALDLILKSLNEKTRPRINTDNIHWLPLKRK